MTNSSEVAVPSTVFVVDDDPAVRDSLEQWITSIGLKSACFSTVEQFLDSYDRSRQGCLVVDIWMPGMNGIELLCRLADEDVSLPIIVVTGHGDVAMCAEAMKRGAIDFLEKPYRPAQLRESIQRAIQIDAINRRTNEYRGHLTERLKLLAPNELAVLKGLLKGKQNKEIASALDISLRTVQLRRSSLMRKLEVSSMPELLSLLAPLWKEEFRTNDPP